MDNIRDVPLSSYVSEYYHVKSMVSRSLGRSGEVNVFRFTVGKDIGSMKT